MLNLIAVGVFSHHLSIAALETIKKCDLVFLQTKELYIYDILTDNKIPFQTFDDLYENSESFNQLNNDIYNSLIKDADKKNVCFIIGGEIKNQEIINLILQKRPNELKLNIINSVSYAQAALETLIKLNFNQNCNQEFYANEISQSTFIDRKKSLIICELDNRLLASDLKILLQEYYPSDYPINFLIKSSSKYISNTIPLYQLDQQDDGNYSFTTVIALEPIELLKMDRMGVSELEEIIEHLRSKDGCQWDRAQTHLTSKNNILEETYEVIEAIELQDSDMLIEELGDVLMQIVFHSQIAKEMSDFTLRDVTTQVCKKLIFRHPHVYGDIIASTPEQALTSWENLKKIEKSQSTFAETLKAVPKTFPALMKAQKVQKRAAKSGFDWKNGKDAALKLKEEIDEFLHELASDNGEIKLQEELGDLLFSVVNVIRLYNFDSEEILNSAIEKFIKRFEMLETVACEQNIKYLDATNDEINIIWEKIKIKY